MKNGLKGLWVNGVGYTTLLTENKLMAHLPVMLADNPQKALVICFGMGTTVRAACIYDDLDITSVELVPKIYECFKYHHPDTEEILSREGLDFVSGDAFELEFDNLFDLVISNQTVEHLTQPAIFVEKLLKERRELRLGRKL